MTRIPLCIECGTFLQEFLRQDSSTAAEDVRAMTLPTEVFPLIYSPSSCLHSGFSTLQLPSFWHSEGCTPQTYFADELKHCMCEELRPISKELYVTVFIISHKGKKRLLIKKETLWKNYVDFVKAVLIIIYVNFITIVTSF